jgi:hypothetical protein
MTDFKKGGPLQNSNIYATNRLFVKNPLFKKKKKKRAPGVYNPKGKFKYEDGGENDCPNNYVKDENGNCVWHDPAQENNIIDKSSIHPVEYLRSQLTMGDPFYNTHAVALNDKNEAMWKLQNEDQIKTNLRNTALKNFIQRHPDESTGLELGYLHNNIWTTPTLGLEKIVEDSSDPGYAPNQLRFERDGKHPNVYFIKNTIKGSAQAPSGSYNKGWRSYQNKTLSPSEYNKAQNEVGQNLSKQGYKGENMWGVGDEDQLYQLYGTEGLTLKGATEITPETLKYLESIRDSEEGKRHLAKLAGISEDDPDYADMLMHYGTTPIDVYAETARPKNNNLIKTEEEVPEAQTFLRNIQGPVSYKNGGSIMDLTEEEIQKYIDGGYIVEEVSDPSIPTLNRFIDGGSTDCLPGYKWNGKKCVEDPFMQGLMSRMRQGNQSKKPVPSLTRKGSKQPVNNSFSNKALLNKEIKQKRNKDTVLQKTFPEVTITGTKTGHMPESFGENVAEFFDPTGYLSWGDAKNAYSDWQESGMDLPTWRQAADMFGAVPALGKFGKLKYLDPSSIKTLYKTIPWQQVINIGDTGEDIDSDNLNQKRKGGSTDDYIEIDIPEEEIQKYIAQGYIVEPVSKLKKFIS